MRAENDIRDTARFAAGQPGDKERIDQRQLVGDNPWSARDEYDNQLVAARPNPLEKT